MEIQINNNLDQWCFDYLENQLSTSHKKAFELELKKNKKAVACLEKWKSSTVTSINYIDFDQDLLIRISKESKKSPLRIIIPVFAAIALVGVILYSNYSKSDIAEIEESITSEIKEGSKDSIVDKPITTPNRVKEIIPNGVPTSTRIIDSNLVKKDTTIEKERVPNKTQVVKIIPKTPKKVISKKETEEIIEIVEPQIEIPAIIIPPSPIQTPTPLQVPDITKEVELTKKEKRKAEKK